MQGNHKFQPELFVQMDYDAIVPRNHVLRYIANIQSPIIQYSISDMLKIKTSSELKRVCISQY